MNIKLQKKGCLLECDTLSHTFDDANSTYAPGFQLWQELVWNGEAMGEMKTEQGSVNP